MRSVVHFILWIALVVTIINKAVEANNGNVGLTVVLAIVFIIIGSLILSLLLAGLWAIVDWMSEWLRDHTY